MKLKALFESLKRSLERGEQSDQVKCERIDGLLAQLKKKEKRLLRKLDEEKNSRKYQRLKVELKVVRAQYRKGKKRREDLTQKCR